MATMAELMNNPLLYAGLGLMSAGARRPANQPGNTGAELMNALGMWQQAQQAQQAMAQRQQQEQRLQQQFEMERAAQLEAQGRAKTAEEQMLAQREAVQNALRQNPNAAPGDITRMLLQATGDPELLKFMPKEQQQQLINVPGGGAVFDPVTRQPIFQNPAGASQQKPQVVLDPGTGVPRLITGGGAGSAAIPGFTPKPSTQAEPEVLEVAPGMTLQTRPLAPKERAALGGDVVAFQSTSANLDRMASAAAELLSHPGLPGISGMRGAFPSVPGGDAFNAEAKLETLKSQVAFSTLQAMRDASKTGGALGNVSNVELGLLQNNMQSLQKAQTLDQYKESLQKIVDQAQATKDRLGNALQIRYGEPQRAQTPGVPTGPTRAPAGITQEDIEYTARKHGVSIEEVKRRLGIQ